MINRKTSNKISMIGDYLGAKTPTTMHCNKCKYEWDTAPYVIYKGGFGCPSCSGKAHRTPEQFAKEVYDLVGDEYTVLGKYVSRDKKVKFLHNICGYEFMMRPENFLHGQRCSNPKELFERRMKSQAMTLTEAQNLLKTNRGGEYRIISGFTKSSGKAKMLHLKCGREFVAMVSPIINNRSGCPYCYSSHGEDAVREYLNENEFEFKEQYRIKECYNKRPLPFDFAVFKNNELLYLIEYQGVQHYFPKFGEENFKETRLRDRIKLDFCLERGIRLIRVPYERWYSYEALKSQVARCLASHLN
ncbi:DUF2726 domain-containing protein [Levilactobacillus tujiorum]|uniref:DUF2726 domain-containing protein n=1 Tax=Levilactobacillus tujiorum TaxID=2912243 RepID=A0ABX1L4T9_9LACO|nr:DUF2726 domain-containing protein [Levilactobacillus tujiorum]MCH5465051.1 hypothetical protein [Levilactobacillus tujiorum]NLR30041.1 DUF2726 domain-containing protein [Levilactobacillus tujiorum]